MSALEPLGAGADSLTDGDDGIVAVDAAAADQEEVAVDDGITVDADAPPALIEVVVVDQAHVSDDHATTVPVFASAARFRPVYVVVSFVLAVAVVLAAYGLSVIIPVQPGPTPPGTEAPAPSIQPVVGDGPTTPPTTDSG